MASARAALAPQVLAGRILIIRGQRVILDSDLAQLYEVETRAFNQAVKRNANRFPGDFMIRLTDEEFSSLRSQNVISRPGGRRYAPMAFTEHGAIMAAAILNSPRAVEMSVHVVRAFVQLREILSTHKELARKLDQLERRVAHHDNSLAEIIEAIRALMAQPQVVKRPIGFTSDLSGADKK
ncbi:MAG: ORF6N domain-containing protein [Ramlibacter sp.]